MSDTCRSCPAPILWAITAKERRMPLDVEPVPWEPEGVDLRGLFAVVEREGVLRAISASSEDAPPWAEAPRHRSHFATCPNAKQHRRRSS